MANSVGNCLSDSYVTKAKRLAKLQHTALRLCKQENAMKDANKESKELNVLSSACAKCRGDAEQSDEAHIEDLCPVDKKRISELIERVADSTKAKHNAEEALAILDAEKKALENRYQLFCSQSENEKSQLQSQVTRDDN